MSNGSKTGPGLLVVMSCWKAMAAVAPVWTFAANRRTRASNAMEVRDNLLFTKQRVHHARYLYASFIEGRRRYGGNLCVQDLKTAGPRQLTFPPAL